MASPKVAVPLAAKTERQEVIKASHEKEQQLNAKVASQQVDIKNLEEKIRLLGNSNTVATS